MHVVTNKQWKEWRELQDPKTLAYLENQPIWRDRDLFKAVLYGIAIGIIVGFIWGYSAGLTDYSNMPVQYLKG